MAKNKRKPSISESDLDFDLSAWIRKFRLDEYEWGASGPGPATLCIAELVRRAADVDLSYFHPVPCDIFVMGYGPPPRRDMTLVGNLPYRPANAPWPVSKSTGRKMTFVCQFRLAESKDLLGDVPGDMLLMFAEDEHDWRDTGSDEPYFEWWPLDIAKDQLIDERQVPKPGFGKPNCYGLRCRYTDLLSESFVGLAFDVLKERPRVKADPDFDPTEVRIRQCIREWICHGGSMKVAGVPTVRERLRAIHENLCCGKFVAQVSSIYSDSMGRYSWLNCETDEQFEQLPASESLIWTGEVIMGIFIDSSGRTVARRLP